MDVLESPLGLVVIEHARLFRQSDACPAPMTVPLPALPVLLVRTILDHGAAVMFGSRSRRQNVERPPRRWSESGKGEAVCFLGSDKAWRDASPASLKARPYVY